MTAVLAFVVLVIAATGLPLGTWMQMPPWRRTTARRANRAAPYGRESASNTRPQGKTRTDP